MDAMDRSVAKNVSQNKINDYTAWTLDDDERGFIYLYSYA